MSEIIGHCEICKFVTHGPRVAPCKDCVNLGGTKERFQLRGSCGAGAFRDVLVRILCIADEDERPYCKLCQPNEDGECKFFDDHELQDSNELYHLCIWPRGSDEVTVGVDKSDVKE